MDVLYGILGAIAVTSFVYLLCELLLWDTHRIEDRSRVRAQIEYPAVIDNVGHLGYNRGWVASAELEIYKHEWHNMCVPGFGGVHDQYELDSRPGREGWRLQCEAEYNVAPVYVIYKQETVNPYEAQANAAFNANNKTYEDFLAEMKDFSLSPNKIMPANTHYCACIRSTHPGWTYGWARMCTATSPVPGNENKECHTLPHWRGYDAEIARRRWPDGDLSNDLKDSLPGDMPILQITNRWMFS